MPQKKLGRPKAEVTRTHRVDVRLTEEEFKMLDKYCQEKGIKHPQGLRDGLKALNKK